MAPAGPLPRASELVPVRIEIEPGVRLFVDVEGLGLVPDGPAMRDKLRYVEDFAQLGSYFDEPVATYSSGMRARLAFGTSMAFDFDYYLIDEILAVGDAGFKAKSRSVFAERLRSAYVILVSHNMNLIRKMCDLVVHLDRGRATLYADVEQGIAAYETAGGAT